MACVEPVQAAFGAAGTLELQLATEVFTRPTFAIAGVDEQTTETVLLLGSVA